MKKVKVYELAKAKKIPNGRAIELLKEKGMKKVSAITYVDPDILDDVLSHRSEPQDRSKVSHLFGTPRGGALAAAEARPLTAVKAEEGKKTETASETAKAAGGKKEKNAPEKETKKADTAASGKGGFSGLAAAAMALSIAALALLAMMYFEARGDRAALREVTSDVSGLKSSLSSVNEMTVKNRGQILDLQQQFTNLSNSVDSMKGEVISSQLKSQSAVLAALAGRLDEPLAGRVRGLADGLGAL